MLVKLNHVRKNSAKQLAAVQECRNVNGKQKERSLARQFIRFVIKGLQQRIAYNFVYKETSCHCQVTHLQSLHFFRCKKNIFVSVRFKKNLRLQNKIAQDKEIKLKVRLTAVHIKLKQRRSIYNVKNVYKLSLLCQRSLAEVQWMDVRYAQPRAAKCHALTLYVAVVTAFLPTVFGKHNT